MMIGNNGKELLDSVCKSKKTNSAIFYQETCKEHNQVEEFKRSAVISGWIIELETRSKFIHPI